MATLDLSRWFAGIVNLRGAAGAVVPAPEMNARVRTAVDTLPVTMFEFDADGIYSSAGGGYLRLFGITPDLLVGRSVFDFPRLVPGKNVMVRRALAGESVAFTGFWPRGRFMIRFVPRFDARGRVEAVVGLGIELAKSAPGDQQLEELLEALRQSEARFRAMCDCAPLGICVSNPRFELGYVNPALCALLDRRPEELLGRKWEELLPEHERPSLGRDGRRPEPFDSVRHHVRRDGTSVWYSLRTATMREDAELLGYVAVVADITQERTARLAIDGAQRDLRRVIEGSPEGTAVVRDQRWIFVNRALVRTLGYSNAEALIGADVSELVHPEDRAQAHALISQPQALTEGGARELRYRAASGEYVLLELRPAALSEFEGAPAVLLSARDITEQRKLQARLAVTERLLAVGTLAAGVAHEINNPLSAALSNLEWVAEQLARMTTEPSAVLALEPGQPGAKPGQPDVAPQRLIKPIDDARDACGRVRAIVQDLKLLSRAQDESVGPVELTTVLDAAVRMVWNEMRHRARLVREYGDLPLVSGNEARLAQVFLNLLINATQAIPEGNASEHEVRLTARALPPGQVLIEVRDTGCGIPDSVLGRIFDPFFTTKPPGVGTGLGLSICQRIVTSMGGHIEVESRLGGGTTFRVTLASAVSSAPQRAALPASAPAADVPRARVLVIDDDPAVGTALKLVLSEEHEVEVHTNARHALERLRSGERYGVILCDVMMPELSGMEFHRQLALSHPELASDVIFLTGGAFALGACEFLDRIPNPRLGKPFNWRDLRTLIGRQLMRAEGDPALPSG
jgi:two-component system, cell cycle sensor histidine kinase and response regulator CckA